jgi:Trypsin
MAEPGRVVVSTSDFVLHEEYSGVIIDNDIGLLKLSESLSGPSMIIFVDFRCAFNVFIADIGSVRLPSRSQATESFAGQMARVSGWGKSSDGKSNTNVKTCNYVFFTHSDNLIITCFGLKCNMDMITE